MAAIKRVVQRYIDEAQRNERYQAKWSTGESATSPEVRKPKLHVMQQESPVPVSVSNFEDASPSLLTTRGPFGAPGSGQPRDGFRMDGRRILQRPPDAPSRPSNVEFAPTRTAPPANHPSNQPSNQSSEKICYRFARGQCDRVDCPFSHDLQLALSFMQSENSKYNPRVHILDGSSSDSDCPSLVASDSDSHED